MDKLHELPRISFIFQRDGFQSAKEYTLNLKRIYLGSVKGTRNKTGVNSAFRKSYLESAYSANHIYRNFSDYFLDSTCLFVQ